MKMVCIKRGASNFEVVILNKNGWLKLGKKIPILLKQKARGDNRISSYIDFTKTEDQLDSSNLQLHHNLYVYTNTFHEEFIIGAEVSDLSKTAIAEARRF